MAYELSKTSDPLKIAERESLFQQPLKLSRSQSIGVKYAKEGM